MRIIYLNLNEKQFLEQLHSLKNDNSEYIIGDEIYSSNKVAIIKFND